MKNNCIRILVYIYVVFFYFNCYADNKRDTILSLQNRELIKILNENNFKSDYFYSILLDKSNRRLTISKQFSMVEELSINGSYNYLYDRYIDLSDAYDNIGSLLDTFPNAKVVLVKGDSIMFDNNSQNLTYESAIVDGSVHSNNDLRNNYTAISNKDIEYSIQIFVSSRNRAVHEFNMHGVYKIYVGGFYKYRIGHYENYSDALIHVNKIIELGFEGAFVVKQ